MKRTTSKLTFLSKLLHYTNGRTLGFLTGVLRIFKMQVCHKKKMFTFLFICNKAAFV
ncbi:unnamed protein product [Larinioides sclopetarius]|uniref:Uncharacterized protein n=1 Tax=Larinioides sclopetarius TaxID=280406 RepID=A0AAV2B3L1_9ARAC